MPCPLCKTELQYQIDPKYFLCSGCNAYVMGSEHWLNADDEKARYDNHNNDVNDPEYRKFVSPISSAIQQDFKPKHLGLDYGCGTGPVIATVLQESGYNVQLFDPFFHPDYSYQDKRYDFIFSCEVFEHFFDPKAEIEKLIALLQPHGKLYIMTHLYDPDIEVEFSKWYYKKDPTHVFIYTKKTMEFIEQHFPVQLEKIDGRLIVYRKIG